jgi:hypothetical protein
VESQKLHPSPCVRGGSPVVLDCLCACGGRGQAWGGTHAFTAHLAAYFILDLCTRRPRKKVLQYVQFGCLLELNEQLGKKEKELNQQLGKEKEDKGKIIEDKQDLTKMMISLLSAIS